MKHAKTMLYSMIMIAIGVVNVAAQVPHTLYVTSHTTGRRDASHPLGNRDPR